MSEPVQYFLESSYRRVLLVAILLWRFRVESSVKTWYKLDLLGYLWDTHNIWATLWWRVNLLHLKGSNLWFFSKRFSVRHNLASLLINNWLKVKINLFTLVPLMLRLISYFFFSNETIFFALNILIWNRDFLNFYTFTNLIFLLRKDLLHLSISPDTVDFYSVRVHKDSQALNFVLVEVADILWLMGPYVSSMPLF
jgi:hypothetical protein